MVRSHAFQVVAALSVVAVATLLRVALDQIASGIVPFATYFPAIMAAALLWGWTAGFSAVVFAAAAAWYVTLAPAYSFDLGSTAAWANLVLFVVIGLAMVPPCALFQEQRVRLMDEQKRSGELVTALRRKSAELETVLETVPAAVWFTFDPEVAHVTRNRLAADLLRVPQAASGSFSPKSAEPLRHVRVFRDGQPVEPDELPLQRAMRGLATRDDELTYRFDSGEEITLLAQGTPMTTEGRVIGAVAVGLDITARRQAETHRSLLVNELNHRVKNVLATVQSMAQLSFRTTSETRALEAFMLRLQAFAAIHDMLTREHWADLDLAALVANVLKPVCGPAGKRYSLHGPKVMLPPQLAVSMSMALHELCTNAIKYGALSTERGHVAVRWSRADGDAGPVEVVWQETGGPAVARPAESGFGSRLLKGLARDIGAIETTFTPDGLQCRIRIDLAPSAPRPSVAVSA